MTQNEALRALGLSQMPATEEALLQTCTELTQRAQCNLTAARDGAATTAIMDELARIREAKLILLPHARGQVAPSSTQQRHDTSRVGNQSPPRSTSVTSRSSRQPSTTRYSSPQSSPGPGWIPLSSTPPMPPSPPRTSPIPPTPPWYYNPPRPSIWSRVCRRVSSIVGGLWGVITWPVVAPWRAIRWIHSKVQDWRAAWRVRRASRPAWKRRVVFACMVAIVCAIAAYRHVPHTASVVVASFPAADCFVDGAYLTTAPSPEVFENVGWGLREVAFVTTEGLTHRFHVLLLPGQTYRIKANLQDSTHSVIRRSDGGSSIQGSQEE